MARTQFDITTGRFDSSVARQCPQNSTVSNTSTRKKGRAHTTDVSVSLALTNTHEPAQASFLFRFSPPHKRVRTTW